MFYSTVSGAITGALNSEAVSGWLDQGVDNALGLAKGSIEQVVLKGLSSATLSGAVSTAFNDLSQGKRISLSDEIEGIGASVASKVIGNVIGGFVPGSQKDYDNRWTDLNPVSNGAPKTLFGIVPALAKNYMNQLMTNMIGTGSMKQMYTFGTVLKIITNAPYNAATIQNNNR
jgi:hypothetical protein